jgi:hypothetical protein
VESLPIRVQDGDVVLAPSWLLTTNHSASRYGQPVLVDRSTGDAFGPNDMVQLGTHLRPAAVLVAQLAKPLALREQRQLTERFCH